MQRPSVFVDLFCYSRRDASDFQRELLSYELPRLRAGRCFYMQKQCPFTINEAHDGQTGAKEPHNEPRVDLHNHETTTSSPVKPNQPKAI